MLLDGPASLWANLAILAGGVTVGFAAAARWFRWE
jgi:hypothetical protein